MISLIRRLALIAASIGLFASLAAAEDEQPFHYERGPLAAKVTDRSTLQVPDGFLWFGPEDAKRALEKMGNFRRRRCEA